MGRPLHDQLIARGILCRIYGPVGSHEDLLPYLVRRLLENGANSSFVNQIANAKTPLEKLIASPVTLVRSYAEIRNPRIPLPKDIYGTARVNSKGLDLSHLSELQQLAEQMSQFDNYLWQATPLRQPMNNQLAEIIKNPSDHRQIVGHCLSASKTDVEQALKNAEHAFFDWQQRCVDERADLLLKAAELLEKHRAELICLTVREAGKTLAAGIAEVREAVDFCRYYSAIARHILAPQILPGPTGETNTLFMRGRGPIVCISPWNFPVAIFTGQIAAALMAGNTVIAKPAEQTPLVRTVYRGIISFGRYS